MDLERATRYRVIRPLGSGGMAEVFLAEDRDLHRPVALKVLKELAGGDAARVRLLREARLASQLSHPGIGVIYEISEMETGGEKRPFIAMEYVEGETLRSHVRTSAPALPDLLGLVRQVADALGAAHERGVVHRDVKPSNLMVTAEGYVKVLDFGLAAYVPPAGSSDDTWSVFAGDADGPGSALLGTLAYMSPEQALGREVDGRSDVFSLGVVLYELVTGELPFRGANAMEVIEAIRHAEPAPTASEKALPAPLEALLNRMLAKAPTDRPPSMREVARELLALEQALKEGTAVPSLPAARGPGRSIAVLAFENITKNPEDDWLGTGIAETASADLKAIEGVTVIARERVNEVLRNLTGRPDAPEAELAARIGRELSARWVVSGGYQRVAGTVRVTARLTEVATGAVLRTVKLDGTMEGLFALQDRVVGELAEGLDLAPAAGAAEGEETQVLEAFEALSKGVVNLRAESPDALDRAIVLFERAVAFDPGYARAWMELGSAYDLKASYLSVPELTLRAIAAFRKALERNPRLTRARRELGITLIDSGRVEEGVAEVRRALELDPGDSGANHSLGRAYFVGLGRFAEAAAQFDRALELNPRYGWAALQLAHCAALLRDFPRAEHAARRAVELQEAFLSGREGALIVGGHTRSGQIAALQGRHEEALVEFDRELAFLQHYGHALKERHFVEIEQRIGSSLLALGRTADGVAALEAALDAFGRRLRMGADDPFTRYYAACAAALLGRRDEALGHLEKAAASRPAFTAARAAIEPDLQSLRADPRFRELLARPAGTGG
ncbi:MAG TPA: protein kinase [Thermoanaerobaculia bacterium]|nr:protein kinase [Thermoanaerobaculia bacterium]